MMRRGVIVAIAVALPAIAAPKTPARTAQMNVGDMVAHLEKPLPRRCVSEQRQQQALASVRFLFDTFKTKGWKDVSADYKQQIAIVRETLLRSETAPCDLLETALRDLDTKAADCREHGMARPVPVRVRAVKDGREVPGWQIFARWTNGRLIGGEKPLRSLSSPAEGEVATPGEYVFQARKPGASLRSEPVRFSVGGGQVFECEIPVP